ncbi:MAG: hypothetical protein ACE15E_05635 [Acidobacteriota bacterium]
MHMRTELNHSRAWWILLVLIVLGGSGLCLADQPLMLLQPDGSGAILNRATGDRHFLRLGFLVEIEGEKPLSAETATQVTDQSAAGIHTTRFEFDHFLVERSVRPGPIPEFCELSLSVTSKTRQSFHLTRVTCGDFRFDKPFEDVILHTDGSILATPINLFLRTGKGGLILGLAYPYQEVGRNDDRRSVSLGYQVHSDVPAGQAFESEPLFVGAYRFSGFGIFKPLARVPYRFITPHPEERDLAEVRAMQDYVRTKLPYYPVPGKGQLFTFLNAWWAGKPLAEISPVIDLMAKVGVPEVMTRETEYGMSSHITRCPELENLPPGYRFKIPEAARPAFEHAQALGMRLATFVNPPRAFRSEWEIRDQAGKPIMYGQIPNVCFASREAAAGSLDVWDQMIKAGGSTFFGFDGRLLSAFNEVDATYFGKIGPIRCYASNHGHRPGQNAYQDYENVQWMMAELRKRNPQAFLEVYWGVKRGMPWSMASFSGCESWYESNGHQDDRMQAWYNQNYRYLPPYQNFAQLKGYTDAEFRKCLISCLGTGSHLQLGAGVTMLDRPANQEFFKKWKQWADENHAFLNVKYDLFGQPWVAELDGSARIIKDRGFIFLFNESAADRLARIPLSDLIGLTSGDAFDVAQVYPDDRPLYVGVKRGATISVPVPASGASVLTVQPASKSPRRAPGVAWHNLPAEVRMEGSAVVVEKLTGYEGQTREIVLLTGTRRPSELRVNGVRVPFRLEGRSLLAGIRFGEAANPQRLDLTTLWKNAPSPGASPVEITDKTVLISDRSFGDGVWDVDMTCDFRRGGFFLRADESLKTGILPMALLNWFAGTNGNISLWHANPAAFPIHWTLGNTLKQGATYRFHIESFGGRQSVSVLDPQSGKLLAGPLSYVVDSIEGQGKIGVRLEGGRAVVNRVAFAPAPPSGQVSPASLDLSTLVHDAFLPREVTRRYGQLAPPGTPIPGGNLIDADYAKEQEALWGGKKD